MPVATSISEAMGRASWIRKMFERGAELKRAHGAENVFDFSLGNPVVEPPPQFFDALERIARRPGEGLHRYMPNAGFPQVRAAVAAQLARDGVFPDIEGSGVIMCVGAGGGLNATLKAILNPGDEVVILAPYFVEYDFYIANHGGVPVVAPTDARFDIDPEALAAACGKRTRAVIVNSPNNPTGRLYPRESLEALGAVLADAERRVGHPIYLLSDEPYREIVYTGDSPPSAASFHPSSFCIYSWSKSLSVPGERIGYVAINPRTDDARGLTDALTFTTRVLGFVNAPAMMQLIAAELLDVRVDLEGYRHKRERILAGLRDAGIETVVPEGTFYVFPAAPGGDDLAFVERAMAHNVLLVPGRGFGGPGYFRLSYAVDDRTVDGGMAALRAMMRG